MKRTLFVVLSVFLLTALLAQTLINNSNPIAMDTHWKKVDQYEKKDRPESALKELENILKIAKRQKDVPQIVKATIYKMRFMIEKNSDEIPVQLRAFEAMADEFSAPADKALIYFMTAQMYNSYYQSRQYDIDKRTDLIGIVPDDIKEWTRNIFTDKIVELVQKSFSNPDALKDTALDKYSILLDNGKSSALLQSTLFDFLSYQKIDLYKNFSDISRYTYPSEVGRTFSNEIIDTYNQIIEYQKLRKNRTTTVYAGLQKLDFENPTHNDDYLEKLNAMLAESPDHESVVEILASKAEYYLEKADNAEQEKLSGQKYKKMAYDIAEDAIKRFPNYSRINLLKNIQSTILTKNFRVEHPSVTTPKGVLAIKVSSTNMKSLTLTLYKVNATAKEFTEYQYNSNERNKLYPNRTKISSVTVETPATDNFDEVKTQIPVNTGNYGIYQYILEAPGNTDERLRLMGSFVVSDLAVIERRQPSQNMETAEKNNLSKIGSELFVLDRSQGNPQKDVKINIYSQNWTGGKVKSKFEKTLATDNEGHCTITRDTDNRRLFFLAKGEDKYFGSWVDSYWRSSTSESAETVKISLLTDRSIYRPGQTLYFKGIAYISERNKQNTATGRTLSVQLFDANGKQVAVKNFNTNEFGSFSGSFILPEDGLNGRFRLSCNGTNTNIWVEEYKRPNFEVSVERPKGEIRFNEEIEITGNVRAYAGYPVGGAKVTYRVVRRPHYCWWWHKEPDKVVAKGEVKSDNDGNFSVKFLPEKDEVKPTLGIQRYSNDSFYTYTVYADATDSKGETQQGSQTLSVGDKSLFIQTDIPKRIEKSQPAVFQVSTQTLNSETIVSVVNYRIIRLDGGNDYADSDSIKWKEAEQVLEGKFSTSDKLEINLAHLSEGQYRVLLTTTDNHGGEVKAESDFVLFDKTSKRMPVKMYSWLSEENTTLAVGEKALVRFGTSTLNASVLYEIMQGNKILERRWITFNNEIKQFEIPFIESYGAGVTLFLTFIKDEKLFTERITLTRKVVEKSLHPHVSVFRDMLKPGEKASWTIHIPESVDDKHVAELLVSMYDASLDAIRPHSWHFNPTFRESVPYSAGWQSKELADITSLGAYAWPDRKIVPQWMLSKFNWFGLDLAGYDGRQSIRIRGMGGVVRESAAIGSDMSLAESKVARADQSANTLNFIEPVVFAAETQTEITSQEPAIRSNFNETAFFYPQLRTDKAGNVNVEFSAPESLTRWNLMMLAHTSDLYFGSNAFEVITQKELMLQMNLPRFVRKGDSLTLSASVTNLTDDNLSPQVELEIFDPATEKTIFRFPATASTTLQLQAKETQSVSWNLESLKDYDFVAVKVIAQAGNFSDGEQKYLPVLPDKVLITESQTMTLRAGQTRVFTFRNFIDNLKNVDTKNLIVEYTGNPTWYAIQALPNVAETAGENAISYLSAYYANTLGRYIALSNPALATTFEQWKRNKSTRDALLSKLEQNSELKNMLLEETPWLMEAENETEQKRNIASLLDPNQTSDRANRFLSKLLKLQGSEGGFAWYDGMPENRYITQEVLLNLARMNKMMGKDISKDTQVWAAVQNALKYLDKKIAKDFFDLKKRNKNYMKDRSIGNMQLFYLHVRSEFKQVAIDESAVEAVNYYTAQSEKYWKDWTLYGRAMMATVAYRNGKNALAEDILTSLQEKAMRTDEMGMYWDANKPGWLWSERPVAVQTAIMEAFAEIRNASGSIDEMKIWLLKNKQTQRWDTPISTLDAIYALLNYGSEWLSNKGDVSIKLGNTLINPQSAEAGSAYIKQSIPVEKLKSEMGNIQVSSQSTSGISWGAVYWQYFQHVDSVQSQGKEMKVEKRLFVERISDTGKTILPIEQTVLRKGDKIITRLVVTTDRDYEYVALKDLRAACLEPVDQNSGTKWKEGVVYYQTHKDASTQFFFNVLPKGTYVFEYEQWANNSGTFSVGTASVQCLYAPEFQGHSAGGQIIVK